MDTFAVTTIFWGASLVLAEICFSLPPGAATDTATRSVSMPEFITGAMALASFAIGLFAPIALAAINSD